MYAASSSVATSSERRDPHRGVRMTIRANPFLLAVVAVVLVVAFVGLASAAGESSPRLVVLALALLGAIGVWALRVARVGRVSRAAQEARPHARYEPVGSLSLGLIVLGWTVVAGRRDGGHRARVPPTGAGG